MADNPKPAKLDVMPISPKYQQNGFTLSHSGSLMVFGMVSGYMRGAFLNIQIFHEPLSHRTKLKTANSEIDRREHAQRLDGVKSIYKD